ncbi:MAG: hypothetical protein QG622_1980 [Actinomycetota bacterium]|nr:hypothetical protein [Actinomycetota bacterium]
MVQDENRLAELVIRPASPSDHERIAGVVDEWWGRPVSGAVPRLFLEHFFATSRIAERDGSSGSPDPRLHASTAGAEPVVGT